MFTRIQTRSFRSLRHVDCALRPFQALVGPNASGKTTFLDVIALLGDLMRNRGDAIATTQVRSANFQELIWMRGGRAFQLAVEARIPDSVRSKLALDKRQCEYVRYEIEVRLSNEDGEIGLDHETLWLLDSPETGVPRQGDFPVVQMEPPTIFLKPRKGRRVALKKNPGGNDNYYAEGSKASYNPSFKLGRSRSALANLPADSESFPVSVWFRDLLERGVQLLTLNSHTIRQPSAPGSGRSFQPDGANLPWVIHNLRRDESRFSDWLNHVGTALDDIVDIDSIERPEDKHRYLVVQYSNGAKVPSWLVSDGTLRLLALTIPAYLKELQGVFLIEEPENGIHPRAIETILQSLSSMYDSQVLVATHSPIAINILSPEDILCFAKDSTGATDIVSGHEHPGLREWRSGAPDLGTLFAAGILS